VGPLALCLLRQGRTEGAKVLIDGEFERQAGMRVIPHFSGQLWAVSAELNLTRLEQAEDAEREGARREAKHSCRRLLKNSKLDKGGFVPGYRMQGTYDWLTGRPRKAENRWRKSLAVAEELGARYQEVQFEAMGAACDLEETRRLLRR
jgi:hypothetical protein